MLTEESFLFSWVKLCSRHYNIIDDSKSVLKFSLLMHNEDFFYSFIIKHFDLDPDDYHEDIMNFVPLKRKIFFEIIENKLKDLNISNEAHHLSLFQEHINDPETLLNLWKILFFISFFNDYNNYNDENDSKPKLNCLINNLNIFCIAMKIIIEAYNLLKDEHFVYYEKDLTELLLNYVFDPNKSIRLELTDRVLNTAENISGYCSPRKTSRSHSSSLQASPIKKPMEFKLNLQNLNLNSMTTDFTTFESKILKSCEKCEEIVSINETNNSVILNQRNVITRLEENLKEKDLMIKNLQLQINKEQLGSKEISVLRNSLKEQRRSSLLLSQEFDSAQTTITRQSIRIEELENKIFSLEEQLDDFDHLKENYQSLMKEHSKFRKMLIVLKEIRSNIKIVQTERFSLCNNIKNNVNNNSSSLRNSNVKSVMSLKENQDYFLLEKTKENFELKKSLNDLKIEYEDGYSRYLKLRENYLRLKEKVKELNEENKRLILTKLKENNKKPKQTNKLKDLPLNILCAIVLALQIILMYLFKK